MRHRTGPVLAHLLARKEEEVILPLVVPLAVEVFDIRAHRGSERRFAALLHESSLARTLPTDRILTCRCDTTLVGRGRSSD